MLIIESWFVDWEQIISIRKDKRDIQFTRVTGTLYMYSIYDNTIIGTSNNNNANTNDDVPDEPSLVSHSSWY
jgi:hypothetical protein